MIVFASWDEAFYYCKARSMPFRPNVIESDGEVAVILP